MKSFASSRKLTSAVGAKSARACDSCVKKRASLYCAADDAFLCQSCDSSVHSANSLARRHHRVRLRIGPFDESNSKTNLKVSVPTWHQGFTRKARTPRMKKHAKLHHHDPQSIVPEICSDEQSPEEENDELLCRVPIFDPFVPSEMGLDEFAAEVECLLGKDLEMESFNMEGLGLLESKEFYLQCERRKGEYKDVTTGEENCGIEMGRANLELNFDDLGAGSKSQQESKLVSISNKTFLKLDFGRVMSDWNGQKSPWIDGERPEINSGEFSTIFFGNTVRLHGPGAVVFGHTMAAAMAEGDREARVSRYREKRRTRLFAKKIRYEVRKLNAEKRPRMKGRFVKRSNL